MLVQICSTRFPRTEMCIIPLCDAAGRDQLLRVQHGVGWRQIIENMHKNATVAEWYKKQERRDLRQGQERQPAEL